MKDINNIEDWYREELSNYNVEPNNNGWQSLSDDLDANSPVTEENIEEWYKKEATKLEERPDYRVWEKLSTKLDTASVWEKLSVSLTRYEQTIWWRNMAIRGSAIFLLFAGSYATYQQYNQEDTISSDFTIKTNNNTIAEQSNTINPHKNNSTDNNAVDFQGVNFKSKATDEKQGSSGLLSTKTTKKSNLLSLSTNDLHIDKFNRLNSPQLASNIDSHKNIQKPNHTNKITENDISSGYVKKDFLVKKKKNKIVFNNKRFSSHFIYGLYARKFYWGVNFGVKKQGLITTLSNDNSMGDFKQEYFSDYGANIGSTFGWIFSDKLNLEANLNFISTAGYRRSFSNEYATFEEELNLNYSTLSILAKKMNNKSTFDNKVYSTNFIGGFYAGYLNASSSKINGQTIDNNNYNKMDFGLVVGIEQDRYITKSLIITPGIRYQQGLINTSNSSSFFESSRNYSLEFNLGIKYIFLKKR